MTLCATRITGAKRTTFNPLTQVTALHAMWANDPAWSRPADGAAVASWRNQSGGGDPAQATGADQPTMRYAVPELNGRSAVEFDGVSEFLDFDTTNTAHPWKHIVVGRYIVAANTRKFVGFGNATTDGFGSSGAGQWGLNNGAGANSAVNDDTVGHVFRMKVGSIAEGCELWMDETSILSGVNSGSNNFNRLHIGASGTTTGANFANCQIAFYGVYTGATSDTDLAALCNALADFYGTP